MKGSFEGLYGLGKGSLLSKGKQMGEEAKKNYSKEKKCRNCWRTETLIRMCNKHPNNEKTYEYTCTACKEFHRIYEGPTRPVPEDNRSLLEKRPRGQPRTSPKRL